MQLLDSETHAFKNGHFMKFGYARVSSNTQDHAAQVEALQAAGCERIYGEKASGIRSRWSAARKTSLLKSNR
jgi:Resolvase, N terminal domain